MKLHLFLLLYVTGVMASVLYRLQSVSHDYYLIKSSATWQQAQNYCRENYDDLATVESDEDWIKLKQEGASKGVTSYAWLGHYNDKDGWYWTLNDLLMKTTGFTKWQAGEPNNLGGREFCVLINELGNWADYTCIITSHFICYNANYSGAARYIGVTIPLPWSMARAYCQQHHTDLARATNSTENDLLKQVALTIGASWIGLYREDWKWSDGTNGSNLRWYPGLPDNLFGSEDCGTLYNGLLGDEKCSKKYYFFCHTVPPVSEQQIVRVQLKADDSVLDPAVQSIILERIKQKLAEQIMLQNITITWKKNRDGSVFNKESSNDDNQ